MNDQPGIPKPITGLKSHKLEFFPDMEEGKQDGPCALVLQFHKPNAKRFNKMNQWEKQQCVTLINQFEKTLSIFKQEIINSYE